MAYVGACPKCGILLAGECAETDCEKCGWNPEVNAQRRKEIAWFAKHGLLHHWGKGESAGEDSETMRKALKLLKLELARLATKD